MQNREVGLVEGLKTIYDEADKQGAFDPIKEKLLNKHVLIKIMILRQIQMYLRK